MLHPAHVGHLGILRALIRDGAARGGFDSSLATDSRDSERVLLESSARADHRLLHRGGPATGDLTTVAVPGYVYHPDRGGGGKPPDRLRPVQGDPEGFELWLTGVDPAWRGHGHGRAMLGALLGTPAGRPGVRRPAAALRPRQPRDGASARRSCDYDEDERGHASDVVVRPRRRAARARGAHSRRPREPHADALTPAARPRGAKRRAACFAAACRGSRRGSAA